MRILIASLVSALFVLPLAAQADPLEIAKGVKEIAGPGTPGGVVVYSEKGRAIVVGKEKDTQTAVVAASPCGAGRAVLFGHGGFLASATQKESDTARFVAAAVRWAGKKSPSAASWPTIAVRRNRDFLKWLGAQKADAAALDGDDWTKRLDAFQVLVWNPDQASDDEIAALRKYLEAGGGLVAAATGWGWRQLNGERPIREFVGNRLLAPYGIGWTDDFPHQTAKDGYLVGGPIDPLTNAHTAIGRFAADTTSAPAIDKKSAAQIVHIVMEACRAAPLDDLFIVPRVHALAEKSNVCPTAKHPVKKDDVVGRLAMQIYWEGVSTLPPEKVTAHPASEFFPGKVEKDAPRVEKTIVFDDSARGRRSTGLYAAPGELIEVRFDKSAVGRGIAVRIGAHSDSLWSKDEWRRAPEITRSWPVNGETLRIASPFGGPIYVELPHRESTEIPATIPVGFKNAVEAPLFVRSKTDLAAWKEKIRLAPAPWAEIVGDRVALTVPSRVVRTLDDPERLMEFWDSYADLCADLAARSRVRTVPERYVLDEQISAGYMHSGYPIMTHTDVAEIIVDVSRLSTGEGCWGFFHEMGHNHQVSDWTFEGTGEVTCNIFALHGLEMLCRVKEGGHGAMEKDAIAKRIDAYFKKPASLERWTDDPFTALIVYDQVRHAFGWAPFRKVFGEYRTLPAAERPKTDDERRDQWLVRLSRAVGRNLSDLFETWGIRTSAAARKSIAELPAWMPEGFPPKS